MKVVKTDKHYMAEPDFEIDHYKDAPKRQYTEFQQNPAPIFRLQQELRRSPSFPHKPVVGSAVASGSSFAPGCRFRPSIVSLIVQLVSAHKPG